MHCLLFFVIQHPIQSEIVYYGLKPVDPTSPEAKALIDYNFGVLDALGMKHGVSNLLKYTEYYVHDVCVSLSCHVESNLYQIDIKLQSIFFFPQTRPHSSQHMERSSLPKKDRVLLR